MSSTPDHRADGRKAANVPPKEFHLSPDAEIHVRLLEPAGVRIIRGIGDTTHGRVDGDEAPICPRVG